MPKINNLMKKKILFCAAEAAPLAKVGGLADVVGSLPAALRGQGIDARVIIPLHAGISWRKLGGQKIFSFKISIEGKREIINVYQLRIKQTIFYLLGNKTYFSGGVYEGDSVKKYLFFSRAVLAVLSDLPFHPDIIHAHDFHAAPIIVELASLSRQNRPALVLTIHNLQHQGWSSLKNIEAFSFRPSDFSSDAKNKQGDWFNLLAAGILAADKITTVSPNYAVEILTRAYGQGLEKLLYRRRRDLVGILNGLDVDVFNAAKDKLLLRNYQTADIKRGKYLNREAIRSYLQFPASTEPLFVFIARFSNQKGLDLFKSASLHRLAKRYPFQLVFLGSGEEKYEQLVADLSKNLSEMIRVINVFDESLAHNLYAAADYFLVPSRFEPCGLTQMIAMRYGAVPIVRATGGLKDTVQNNKTGLVFKDYSAVSFANVLEKALKLYYQNQTEYLSLQAAGRAQDWSWAASAPEYRRLYDLLGAI
jgi:starch synthase